MSDFLKEQVVAGSNSSEGISSRYKLFYKCVYDIDSHRPIALEFGLKVGSEHCSVGIYSILREVSAYEGVHNLVRLMITSAADIFWAKKRQEPLINRFLVPILLRDLQNTNFCLDIVSLKKQLGLPDGVLCINVSEKDPVLGMEVTKNNLKILSESGIGVALHHYCSGLTSMHYLLNLPLNVIKLDTSLAKDISQVPVQLLVEVIFRSCQQLNIELIADGIECTESLSLLASLGCSSATGNLFDSGISQSEWLTETLSFKSSVTRSKSAPSLIELVS